MTFYERYEMLCSERNIKPQTKEILDILGVTSPTISGWKNGSSPKTDAICSLAAYFNVTTDYLLGLSELRSTSSCFILTEEESILVNTYRAADTQGRFRIIHACMTEAENVKTKENANVG